MRSPIVGGGVGMVEGGRIFSGVGEVVEKIKSPPDLFLIVGAALFGLGVFKGPFSIDNLMMEWGIVPAIIRMICLTPNNSYI